MRHVAALVCVAVLLAGAPAAADEREDLMRQIGQEYDALSTSDCLAACKALASMQRAADRLCELDTGTTCAEARAKVDDARRRVRAACPMCAVEKKTTDAQPPPPPPAPAPEAQTASGPPQESARGGCASCNAGAAGGDALGGILAAAWLLARRRRRNWGRKRQL
jgi:MYXO-CTERM domain-containing protein